ncbi:MAG TPA: ribonuclease III family protein, partial [Candidatus Hypogeohydataceae bacterium YC40]
MKSQEPDFQPTLGGLKECQTALGYTFKDVSLLEKALIHTSCKLEYNGSNERLEFLGDSVLNFTVSKYLYRTYPDHPEGDLTNFRASIVKTHFLSKISGQLNLGKYILMSRGEEESGGRERETILADT